MTTTQKYPKSIDTLIEDIYALMSEDANHVPSEESLKKLGEDVVASVKKQLEAREPVGRLRMSNIGKKDRQLYYDMKKPEDSGFPPNMILRFLIGDITEAVLLFLAREAGHSVEDEQKEVEIDGVKGHQDAKIDGIPTDIKSTSPNNFKKFDDGSLLKDDPYGYIGQISGYTEAQEAEEGAFLALDVSTGRMALLKLHSMEMINASDRIGHLKEMLEKDEPPTEKCYPEVPEGVSGNMRLGFGCQWCPHKKECWKDANGGHGLRAFKYSNGTKYFTKVVKEPKVDEVDL